MLIFYSFHISAIKNNGYVIGLMTDQMLKLAEHRCLGLSFPTPGLDTDNFVQETLSGLV